MPSKTSHTISYIYHLLPKINWHSIIPQISRCIFSICQLTLVFCLYQIIYRWYVVSNNIPAPSSLFIYFFAKIQKYCSHHMFRDKTNTSTEGEATGRGHSQTTHVSRDYWEVLGLFLCNLSIISCQYLQYRRWKTHQIEDETLPAKYDINELEFLKDEFRNGTTVENGAREHIGGSPTRLFLLLWHLGRGIGLARLGANLRV